MSSATHPSSEKDALTRAYREALESFLAGAGEVALQRGYQLGRQAMSQGIGIVDMALIHHQALDTALSSHEGPEAPSASAARKAAGQFFAEALGAHEMAYRGFHEANQVLYHFNEILEQQAKQIAHAIHDEAGQLLVAVHLALADVVRDAASPLVEQRAQNVTKLLYRVEEELRRLSHELRPTLLDDLGLIAALESLADKVSKRHGIRMDLILTLHERLPDTLETALYRIVQEAMNNVTKHAHARGVRITLARDASHVRCSVRDDGVGFDAYRAIPAEEAGGLGLVGIRERVRSLGGILEVRTSPGQGTELLIAIPWER